MGAFDASRMKTAAILPRGRRRAQQKSSTDSMSDDDLTKAVRRLSLEKQYKNLTKKSDPPSKLEPTKKVVDATSELVNRVKKMEQDSRKGTKKERMDPSKKTDKELRDQINRELFGTAVQRFICQGVGI